MKEAKPPLRVHHYLGWVFLGVTLVPLIILSLYLHMKEERELRAEQNSTRWQTNWSQLKIGMSKEEVLTLLGTPNSTTIMEGKVTTVTTDPPDQKLSQDIEQTLDQVANYAIWSYHGPLIIHTRPGETVKAAETDGEIQLKELVNFDADAHLHGHAIKFGGNGQVVEIFPVP